MSIFMLMRIKLQKQRLLTYQTIMGNILKHQVSQQSQQLRPICKSNRTTRSPRKENILTQNNQIKFIKNTNLWPVRKSVSPAFIPKHTKNTQSSLNQKQIKTKQKNFEISKISQKLTNNKSPNKQRKSIFKKSLTLNCNNKQNQNNASDILHKNNINKCTEIYRKIKSLNQFLNQVKRRLKFEAQVLEQNKNTNEKQCQIMFRLDNSNIELEKYTPIFTRQLSRQHSIEKIEIEQKKYGQKMMIIHYNSKDRKISSQVTCQKQQKENGQRRVSKIQNLMEKLNNLQKEQLEGEKKLQEILSNNDHDSQPTSNDTSIHQYNNFDAIAKSRISAKFYFN